MSLSVDQAETSLEYWCRSTLWPRRLCSKSPAAVSYTSTRLPIAVTISEPSALALLFQWQMQEGILAPFVGRTWFERYVVTHILEAVLFRLHINTQAR